MTVLEAHLCQVVRADQAGWSGADDNDVALDQLIELFIVFPRDVAGDIALS